MWFVLVTSTVVAIGLVTAVLVFFAERRARQANARFVAARWKTFGESRGFTCTADVRPEGGGEPVEVRATFRKTASGFPVDVELSTTRPPGGAMLPATVRVRVGPSPRGVTWPGTKENPHPLTLDDLRDPARRQHVTSQFHGDASFHSVGDAVVVEAIEPRRLRWLDTLVAAAIDLAEGLPDVGERGYRG